MNRGHRKRIACSVTIVLRIVLSCRMHCFGDDSELEGENQTEEVFASAETVPGRDARCLFSGH